VLLGVIKKERPGGLIATPSLCDRFSVSLIEFLNAISDEAKIDELQCFHVFERPVKSLEDREGVG
jgi:hypothetical protein